MPVATKHMNNYENKYKDGFSYFVHYTSAEAAINILDKKCLWMRNTNCMSDYREIHHGIEFIEGFLNSADCKKLISALQACQQNEASQAISEFIAIKEKIRKHTYITSISEHNKEDEDIHGRLSMWRAYSGTSTGIAIVFKTSNSDPIHIPDVFFSPVAYLKKEEIHKSINEIINNIEINQQFLCTISPKTVKQYLINTFVAAASCLKHPGFKEEKEWRIVHSPKIFGNTLEYEIITINSVPQMIYKLQLINQLEPSRLIDRIIIGPSQYTDQLFEAFTTKLRTLSISNPESRVIRSLIPLRT
ncbi:MAG: DUF2971 domain-containing protein [Bdellovibrionales bacterium]